MLAAPVEEEEEEEEEELEVVAVMAVVATAVVRGSAVRAVFGEAGGTAAAFLAASTALSSVAKV